VSSGSAGSAVFFPGEMGRLESELENPKSQHPAKKKALF